VGGVVKHSKLDRLSQQLDFAIEWIATDDAGVNALARVAQRVRDRRVAAVIVLDELIGHRHYEPIVMAARQASVPIGHRNRGGLETVRRVLREIDEQLTQARST
jgi:hypothetical protein